MGWLIIVLTLGLAHLSWGDLLRHCSNETICQNGGRCFLSSTILSSAKCSDAHFSDTDQKCLTLERKLDTFDAAQKHCSQRGAAHLVWIESAQKREWMREEMLADLDGVGVWIGARWDPGDTLKWTPNGSVVELTYYDSVGRNREVEKAASLDASTLTVWPLSADEPKCAVFYSLGGRYKVALEPCDEQHASICEAPVDSFDANNKWQAQCACQRGFAGRYCEWRKVEDEAYDRVRCANESLSALCNRDDGTLVIDYALYGRSKELPENACQTGHETSAECVEPASLAILMNKCQGRKSCKVDRIADLFDDLHCRDGMSTHLRMRCSQEPETRCREGTVFVNERCYELSGPRNKRSYAEARLYCERKGAQLAYFNESVKYSQLMSQIRPIPDSEYWLHNRSTGNLPLIGPRRAECISVSWWSVDRVSQVPCYAKLGWICEYVPTGFGGAPRVLDVPRASSQKPTRRCPSFQWEGQTVPETNECQAALANCPSHLEGSASFKCSCTNGNERLDWASDEPDLTQCMSKSIAPLKALVSSGQEPLNVIRRFQWEIRRLVEAGQITSGDIIGFIDSAETLLAKAHQRISDRTQTKEWRENYGREFSKALGDAGDHLLDEHSERAWSGLSDEQRIDRAARLMTLLQNMLIVRGAAMEAGSNASLQFRNYEGHIQLKDAQPATQDSPLFVNRVMRIQGGEEAASKGAPEDAEPERIRFRSGSAMELPSTDFLSSIAPRIASPTMFMTHSKVEEEAKGAAFGEESDEPETVKIGYFMFSKLGQLLTNSTSKRRLNSDIIGAFVNDAVLSVRLDANAPANFTFRHLLTEGVSNPKCVSWDVLYSTWSTEGCRLVRTNKTTTLCSCVHLTSFAILMDFSDSLALYGGRAGSPKRWEATTLDILTVVGCAISIACLFACVLIFTLFRSLYNARTTIHRNLCVCLLLGELLFLFGIDSTENATVCQGIAVFLHYFFICAFAWMLLEGYQLYLMLIKVFEANRTHIAYYYFIGYLLPALLVATAFILEPRNYGTRDYCWIDVNSPTIWAFVGPISAIILFNSGVLFVALRTVLSVQNRDRSLADKVLGWLKGSAMLLCLLGLTWAFGFLSAIKVMQPLFAFAFTVLNSLQGMFIFVLHVLMNDKTRQVVGRCFRRGGICCTTPTSLSDSSQQSSSDKSRQNNSNGQPANMFALNRILQWLPLKATSSSSSTGSSSRGSAQKRSSNNLEARFKPANTSGNEDANKQEDEAATRKRLLSGSPLPSPSNDTPNGNVIVERF